MLGLDYLDDTVKTPEDIARLGLPFLALIPAARSGRDRPSLSGHNDFAEAIRSLRTSIALSTRQGGSIVLVTSAQPLEGKTTTACNLAMALAYGGAKVLLIDADMRRPGVHRIFGLENRCGLSELLSGQAPLAQSVQRLAEPDLWIMPAGATPPNPSELLASGRMEALLGQVQNGPFDWVIVDTPPVLAVTDASILTQWVSGVAFVVGSEMTRRRLAERAIETLAAGRPRILGAVSTASMSAQQVLLREALWLREPLSGRRDVRPPPLPDPIQHTGRVICRQRGAAGDAVPRLHVVCGRKEVLAQQTCSAKRPERAQIRRQTIDGRRPFAGRPPSLERACGKRRHGRRPAVRSETTSRPASAPASRGRGSIDSLPGLRVPATQMVRDGWPAGECLRSSKAARHLDDVRRDAHTR